MNTYKIQSDILKLLVDNKREPVFCEDYDDDFVLIGDGKFFAVMLKEEMFLSFPQSKECLYLRKLQDDYARFDYKLAKMSYQLNAKISGSNKTIPCLRLVSEECAVFVANKYIKYFDKDALYYIYAPRAIVFVLEDDALAGAIYPVVIREEDVII